MNRHVNAISGRLSLRPPQRRSLEILDRVMEIAPPGKDLDPTAALAAIRSEFPTVTEFERDFPSLCFALATGVGKTRLMGAFVAYLHLAHGIDNFFVLAPSLTIYNKLIADFTPNTPKYVFRGIAEFSTSPPEIITGDNYESRGLLLADLTRCKVNIFNIAKINSEVRGGKSPRIKRLSEFIGQSYFEYLAGLDDLVILMDESHRYRASAGVRAINELRPILGLELTATPFVESGKAAVPFKNIVLDYPLGQAMADGFVKEPAVVTRKNFDPSGMAPAQIERLKLEDGIRLHEQTKVLLETYARETGQPIVKPFVLVIARDTTHATQLLELLQSDEFFQGRYRDKVIQVDSSKTGADEEAMIERLLKVEHSDDPTEIVIHVNMLKEGWDVTNLYTIVPLRAANARVLIEQSIGRGLRLPFGKRTGVTAVDRLSIVAHDRFQEIVDEAARPESPIRMQSVILDPSELEQKAKTVVLQSRLANALGIRPPGASATTEIAGDDEPHAFESPADEEVARIAYDRIRALSARPDLAPSAGSLTQPALQAQIAREVEEIYRPAQLSIAEVEPPPNVPAIVAKTTELLIRRSIDIPRVQVVPRGDVRSAYEPFELDLRGLRYQVPSEDLWVQYLRTRQRELVTLEAGGFHEPRLENYVVAALIDFNDVAYDVHSDLLYALAGQVVAHLQSYLPDEQAVRRVLRLHQRDIARFVHAQMLDHYSETATEYEVVVTRGFTELKPSAFTQGADDVVLDFRVSPKDKSNMARYLFGGFERCLYPHQKFHSDAERILAVILDRESIKWFRPVKGQFQIFYGRSHSEYQPDFVAETEEMIYLLEPKARNQMEDPEVLAKRTAAERWCELASGHARKYAGKPWQYALIPHDVIRENMTVQGLVGQASSTTTSKP